MELGQIPGMEKENVQLPSVHGKETWIQETVEYVPQGWLQLAKTFIQHRELAIVMNVHDSM